MHKHNTQEVKMNNTIICLLFFLFLSSIATIDSAVSPKEFLNTYWDKEINNGGNLPKPLFLFSMASPLTAVEEEKYVKLAASNVLSTHLAEFCSKSKLFCFPDAQSNYKKNYANKGGVEGEDRGIKISYSGDQSGVEGEDRSIKIAYSGDQSKSNKQYGVALQNLNTMFFRERQVKEGTTMVMPDIADYYPRRSFLPRTIVGKIPFSSSKINQMMSFFKASDNSSLHEIMKKALSDCERSPNKGETKQCVSSIEEMVDFSVAVLGRNMVVRTTKNSNGSSNKIMVGQVLKVNGGNVSKSITCHSLLFPYQVYYCHEIPNVRLYQVDIHDPETKVKINQAIAICHLDTSSWNPGHAAFMVLGSGPGLIEACHWISENQLSWTLAD